jgi:hypothetical protein
MFARSLQDTRLSWAITHYPWIWPACETLHLLGLALLVGVTGTINLRVLGVAKGMPLGPLQRLMPWAFVGFVVTLITGVLFLIGTPFQYLHNIAFQLKILLIMIAGVNVILFYVSGLYRHVDGVGTGHDVPPLAKVAAAVSLVCWIGVTYLGRMLPFIGDAF